MDRKVGKFFYRYRSFTPIPLIIVLVYIAQPTLYSLLSGTVVVLGGEALRIWGVGYLRGGRARRLKAERLVMAGPYQYVRNPLYLGNFLLWLGFVIFSGSLIMLLVAVILYGFQYGNIILFEEEFLQQKFPHKYEEYCERVPRLIPHFPLSALANPDSQEVQFDLKKALSSEQRTFQSIFVVYICLLLKFFL